MSKEFLSRLRGSGWLYSVYITGLSIFFFLGIALITGVLATVLLDLFLEEDSVSSILNLIIPLALIGGSIYLARFSIKKDSGSSVRELLYLNKPKKNAIWLTPVIAIIYVLVLIAAISVLIAINPEAASQEQEVAKEVARLVGWQIPVGFIGIGLMTPIAEELFFRGVLTNLYAKRIRRTVAIFLASALFALAHAQLNVGVDTFFFGIALGILTWKTESIYPAILLHMAKNCIALSVIIN